MPIIFVHGVATRNRDTSRQQVEPFLKRFIAPEISDNPDRVELFFPYWGDIGANLAWGGISRPRSAIMGMGSQREEASAVERAMTVAELSSSLAGFPTHSSGSTATGGLAPAGPRTGIAAAPLPRMKDLTPDELSDLIATVILSQPQVAEPQQVQLVLVADAIAHDPTTFNKLAACPDTPSELDLLRQLIGDRYHQEQSGGLAGQGAPPAWLQDFRDRFGEDLDRSVGLPGFVTTRVLTEVRRPLNDFVTLFFGDVFKYLGARGNAAAVGAIPQVVLAELDKAIAIQQTTGEAIVVLSHSMGGQIVYDLVTHFLPRLPQYQQARIDFWCATASQVGFFEELKLFLESQPKYGKLAGNVAPYPDRQHLGTWWNVWDPNDFISYTAKGIIADVDDAAYNSGMSVIGAHGGYLERPSFFRAFADKVRTAKQANWGK